METEPKSNCCLYAFLSCGFLILCIGLPILVGSVWAGGELYKVAMASPTPIDTCRGMMDDMQLMDSPATKYKTTKKQDMVVYKVEEDKILNPELLTVDETLLPLQQDLESQQRIWEQFIMLIPLEQRKPISHYKIFTDGTGNFNAMADLSWNYGLDAQGSTLTEDWYLEVDLADFTSANKFTWALIHEYGHFVTLQVSQIDYMQDMNHCSGLKTESGCLRENAYLQKFFDRYWATFSKEWQGIESLESPEKVQKGLDAYYVAHPKDFVSTYALTKPQEDIAESWRFFILSPAPKGNTLADQKVLFFYEFPELVKQRSTIINRLCNHYNFPTPTDESN
jgi:hypothetical protein